jgi:glycosyltransferase involved in cell wall biosynthesis
MAGGTSAESPMRVLAVYPWPAFWSMGEGRGAAAFFLSVTSFPQHGHEMHVLMPGPPGAAAEEDYHGVRLHRMTTRVDFMPERGRSRVVQHVRILVSYVVWRVRALRAGLALAARLEPDVVLGMGALGAPVARAIARARGVPNVTRLFGTSLGEVMRHPLKRALRYPEIVAFRTPANAVIVCDDGSGGDEIARRYGVPADRLVFLPDGVDKGRFGASHDREAARRDLNIPPNAGVVLSVSRLHPEKHIERLLKAAPRVLAARPDTAFVVAGEGEEGARLKALAADLGIERSVIFTGPVSLERLPAVYAAADVFVTLSDRTNVLNPLHEAMMSGLPVIALNTGRTGKVVRNDENGVLLEPAGLAGLADAMLRLLSDEPRRKALGAAARASADEKLPSIEERQAAEVEVVQRVVSARRSGRGR